MKYVAEYSNIWKFLCILRGLVSDSFLVNLFFAEPILHSLDSSSLELHQNSNTFA